jgi:Flp pilus assembly protein TadD
MEKRKPNGTDWAVALALYILTLIVFLRLTRADFIVYDDPMYVTQNPHLTAGLTPATIRWAMTTFYAANWHPLTWLSHALDEQFFGPGPVEPHCVNIALHALASGLLFVFLVETTQERWPSAFAAALFAWHPLRVESVAWVTERKDVLSAVFFFLTLLAYVWYLRGPRLRRYAVVMIAFALGLMAKSMLVTVPFLLLVLDFWPLQRRFAKGLILEKLPLLALSAASSVLTWLAQRGGGAIASLRYVPMSDRFANALVSYARYIAKMIWPTRLSVFYPLPPHWPTALVSTVAILLVLMTILAAAQRRQRPFLLTGWLWFLGMLFPVIGLVQVGSQSIADRYTYLPSVGLCVIFSWEGADLWQRFKMLRTALTVTGAVAAMTMALLTFRQTGFWRNSQTLFHHALDVTGSNYVAHDNLGGDFFARGDLNNAEREYQATLRDEPNFFYAHNALGLIQLQRGRLDDAKAEFEQSLRFHDDPRTRIELGNIAVKRGRFDEAETEYDVAVALDPDDTTVQYNLGTVCLREGKITKAIQCLDLYINDHPDDVAALTNLGMARGRAGNFVGAAQEFERAIALQPDDVNSQCGLAASLAHLGRWREAAEHYQAALDLRPGLGVAQRGLSLCRRMQSTGSSGD